MGGKLNLGESSVFPVSESSMCIVDRLRCMCDELVESEKAIAVYGAGSHTLFLFQKTRLSKANLIALIDRDIKRHQTLCWGIPILHPDDLDSIDVDVILVSVPNYQDEIKQDLKRKVHPRIQILCAYANQSEVNAGLLALESSIHEVGVKLGKHAPMSDWDRYGDYRDLIQIYNSLGYLESIKRKAPCDANGQPLPWYSYPAIFFLRQFTFNDCCVFEWGAGHSSLFYASRCRSVRSIDISEKWVSRLRKTAPDNLEIHHVSVSQFPDSISNFNDKYDIIVIDAERRFDCAEKSLDYIKPDGMIILDNSDNCVETCQFLRSKDFVEIDFTGFAPGARYRSTTSIFFRGNCFPLQLPRAKDEPVYGLTRSLDYYYDEDQVTRKMKVAKEPPDEVILSSGQVSYSLTGSDLLLQKMIYRCFPEEKGFYVDVGANDPIKHSLTYNFYKQGWQGINIEPRPGSKAFFDRIRPRDINIETGVSDEAGELTYHLFALSVYNTFDSDLAKEYAKATKPLGSSLLPVQRLDVLLDEYVPKGQAIDLLSVDVEGFELNVLRSSNWEKYRPLVVALEVLEYDLGRGPEQAEPVQFMMDHGYRFLAKTENTLIFADASRYSLFSSAK